MPGNKQQGYECPKCKNNYSTAYSMYRHMRKVHNCDINRCVTLYCPIENCNQSYDRYNALDTHLTHVHYADIRKETFNFSDLQDFEAWLRDITSSSKTKYIKRSCNNSYRYYRCHRSGLPKTSTDRINSMKSTVKIGRHCPSRIIAKITVGNVQVEFVPTHIGHECEIAKIPLSQKKRQDMACRLSSSTTTTPTSSSSVPGLNTDDQKQFIQPKSGTTLHQQVDHEHHAHQLAKQSTIQTPSSGQQHSTTSNPSNLTGFASNPQTTAPTIIQNDSSLVVTLAPMKTPTTTVALPNQAQQQQMAAHPLQQQLHIVSSATHQLSQQQQTQISNGQSLNMMVTTIPNRQELTNRFEQLMSIIRSDKHASIVKAQLEVCFALIRD